jgi:hypothetical protein
MLIKGKQLSKLIEVFKTWVSNPSPGEYDRWQTNVCQEAANLDHPMINNILQQIGKNTKTLCEFDDAQLTRENMAMSEEAKILDFLLYTILCLNVELYVQ